jgi:hypothetical protein
MSTTVQNIYTSANGDTWRLIRDAASGQAIVRHEANQPAGGTVTDTDVDAFLHRAGAGPEFAALRRLLDAAATNDANDNLPQANPPL